MPVRQHLLWLDFESRPLSFLILSEQIRLVSDVDHAVRERALVALALVFSPSDSWRHIDEQTTDQLFGCLTGVLSQHIVDLDPVLHLLQHSPSCFRPLLPQKTRSFLCNRQHTLPPTVQHQIFKFFSAISGLWRDFIQLDLSVE